MPVVTICDFVKLLFLGLFERGVFIKILPDHFDLASFAFKIIGHSLAQTRMGNVMRRMGGNGPIATRQLVLALRASLDRFQAAFNGKVDGLMVADLEMQEGVVFNTAPVAAKKRVGADEIDCASNIATVAPCHHQQNIIGHLLANQ
mgnify:CR=1 FL=1